MTRAARDERRSVVLETAVRLVFHTVLVFGGTYAEVVEVANSGTSTAPIVIQAAPGETVTVQGGDRGFSVSSVSWVTIGGFHVVDTIEDGIRVSSSSNVTIEGNEVSGAGAPVALMGLWGRDRLR